MVQPQEMNKEETIGFHKGALSILVLEQQEFFKILQVIQAQIEGHVKALKELGIDLEAEAKKMSQGTSTGNVQGKMEFREKLDERFK